MSQLAITIALETKLSQITPYLPTQYENFDFEPEAGKSYQVVDILFAKPENPTFGDNFFRQRGYMQVRLKYNLNVGRADAQARADLLQNIFHRGLSLEAHGITTTIEETPEIGSGNKEGDRFVMPVRIRFFANIQK